MGTDKHSYVLQLKAIAACGQSNGYLKKWADDKLSEIEARTKTSLQRVKLPASVK